MMSDHMSGTGKPNDDPQAVVELNVGGVYYSTSLDTLRKDADSCLARMFSDSNRHKAAKDTKGKYFIDRDGVLFRYVLDYLRNMRLVLPENFHEKERLRQEAEYFNLPNLAKIVSSYPGTTRSLHQVSLPPLDSVSKQISPRSGTSPAFSSIKPVQQTSVIANELSLPTNRSDNSTSTNSIPVKVSSPIRVPSPVRTPVGEQRGPGYITVGYRGTFAFGRDGLADVKFRKLSRIIICGKISLCREVFKNTLNESRDPDRGECDRYTSRFFLKHSFLEQAFDMLQEGGFSLVASCGSGTNSAGEVKPGLDNEEAKWQHYNEFIFERR